MFINYKFVMSFIIYDFLSRSKLFNDNDNEIDVLNTECLHPLSASFDSNT